MAKRHRAEERELHAKHAAEEKALKAEHKAEEKAAKDAAFVLRFRDGGAHNSIV